MARTTRRGWSGLEFRVRVAFRVPLDFAFAWCTDFSPEDGTLEGETFERTIIEGTTGSVRHPIVEAISYRDGAGLRPYTEEEEALKRSAEPRHSFRASFALGRSSLLPHFRQRVARCALRA